MGSDYGISRIDDEHHRAHAWRVSLVRNGRKIVRNFPDLKFGSRAKALQAARLYRDLLAAQHRPMLRSEFADVRRRNNRSGVTGVCLVRSPYTLSDGTRRESYYWEAIWPTRPGENERCRFPVTTHGDAVAFDLACSARARGLAQVEGYFWASEKGATLRSAVRGRADLRSDYPSLKAGSRDVTTFLSRERHLQKKVTDEHIVEKATGLFAERGYADVSMRDISAACATHAARLYYYFRNKEDLYEICCEKVFASLSLALRAPLETGVAAELRLAEFMNTLCKVLMVEQRLRKILQWELLSEPRHLRGLIERHFAREFDLLLSTVREVCGSLDEANERVYAIHSMVVGLIVLRPVLEHAGGKCAVYETPKLLARFVLRTLLPAAKRPAKTRLKMSNRSPARQPRATKAVDCQP